MFDNLFGRFYEQFIVQKGYQMMLDGLKSTVIIALGALVIGVLMGTLVAIVKVRQNRGVIGWILSGIADIYIAIIRGTPVMVQLLLVYFGLLSPLGVSAMIVAILVFGLNSGAYVAEIIRSGIQAVDKGQMEAARSIGMTRAQAMKLIVIPQALKIVLPSFGNEFVSLIKETSVLSYVGVVEILRKGALWNAATFNTFEAYIGVALVYMLLTIPSSKLVKHLEKKMANSNAE